MCKNFKSIFVLHDVVNYKKKKKQKTMTLEADDF